MSTAEGALGLDGIVLPDARTGRPLDLGREPPLGILVAIRHRY